MEGGREGGGAVPCSISMYGPELTIDHVSPFSAVDDSWERSHSLTRALALQDCQLLHAHKQKEVRGVAYLTCKAAYAGS